MNVYTKHIYILYNDQLILLIYVLNLKEYAKTTIKE